MPLLVEAMSRLSKILGERELKRRVIYTENEERPRRPAITHHETFNPPSSRHHSMLFNVL